MASFNKVLLMGNLTRDPELRYTAGGSPVASLGLAVNRKYRQGDEMKEETCFVDVTVWGKLGETCAEYLTKGRPVFVEGRLNFRTWETEDGQKRSKLDVVAYNVQFLGRGKDNEGADRSGDGFATPMESVAEDDVPF